MIQSLNSFELYENYAYHISLLRQFVSLHSKGIPITTDSNKRGGQGRSSFVSSSVHGNNVWKSMKNIRGLDGSGSIRSTSGRSSRRGSLPTITKSTNNAGIGGGEKGGVVVATEDPNADLSNGGSKSGRGMRRIVSATGVLSSMK
jgi:hypothetical protein